MSSSVKMIVLLCSMKQCDIHYWKTLQRKDEYLTCWKAKLDQIVFAAYGFI